jgi:hypothetical protein
VQARRAGAVLHDGIVRHRGDLERQITDGVHTQYTAQQETTQQDDNTLHEMVVARLQARVG